MANFEVPRERFVVALRGSRRRSSREKRSKPLPVVPAANSRTLHSYHAAFPAVIALRSLGLGI